jgi:hypothetical protein
MAKLPKENVFSIVSKPNSTLLGFRLRLNLYNLANLNPDSTYQANLLIIREMKENQNGYPQNKSSLGNHFGIMEFMIS